MIAGMRRDFTEEPLDAALTFIDAALTILVSGRPDDSREVAALWLARAAVALREAGADSGPLVSPAERARLAAAHALVESRPG